MRDAGSHVEDAGGPLARFWTAAEPLEPPREPSRAGRAPSPNDNHRERLRQRIDAGGFGPLPDYELLELYLFRSIRRADTKPLAKALLARFGSLQAVMAASIPELRSVKGVGAAVALDLKLLHEAAVRTQRQGIERREVISSWTALAAYVRTALAHESREQFRVLFLDRKNQLIADEILGQGTIDHAPVYPREVARRALELAASSLILVHNHPSGDPTPSSADIDMTRQVVEAARTLKISVHDHLVVGRQGLASFKALGLL